MSAESYLALLAREASAVESVQPLVTALGGGAALGSVLAFALEMRSDKPKWDRAAAYGSVGGALFGAFLLVVDMSRAL